MKTPFVLLLICGCMPALAQHALPVYTITTDTTLLQVLDDSSWQVLPDKENQWRLEDVRKEPLDGQFVNRNAWNADAATDANTCWLRYRLQNAGKTPASIALGIQAEQVDYYVSDTLGGFRHFFTGTLVQRSKKDGLKADNYIPLTLSPGEIVTVYEKIHDRAAGWPQAAVPGIANTARLIAKDYVENADNTDKFFNVPDLQTVFLIGLLSIAILFSVFFYVTAREKEYLYFALLLFFLVIVRLINPWDNYLGVVDPLMDEKLGFLNMAWPLIMLCLVQFVRYFFKLHEKYPRLSRFLLVLALIGLLQNTVFECLDRDYLLDVTKHILWFTYYQFTQGTLCISVLLVFFLYLRQKHREIKLVVIGGFPLIALWGFFFSYAAIVVSIYKTYTPPPGFADPSTFWLCEIFFIAWFVVFFSLILFMRFNTLRKENLQHALERASLVEGQKIELEKQVMARTRELQQSMEELKATQRQLVQQEKMASLGELTAGIAHEIQNPLNFVNNFSELNKELIAELKEERSKPEAQRDLSLQEDLLADIASNSAKINEHGRRADAIVKGMLQHSRASSGKKEPTAINALCDQYLRLSYHGLRAKDKSFQSDYAMDFDPAIGKINIVPQEIGRVLLNLFNNAFYAVNERRKVEGEKFSPRVTVSTQKAGDKVLVSVSDNGEGIAQSIVDKIFQPFFTTKPTGQGTGLGLSMAYDIVKSHGSELKVNSRPGEGTVFTMVL